LVLLAALPLQLLVHALPCWALLSPWMQPLPLLSPLPQPLLLPLCL